MREILRTSFYKSYYKQIKRYEMNFRITSQKICNNHFNQIINFGIFAKKFFKQHVIKIFGKIIYV
jgi:hypothetical protein